jgi:hypothetical protein
MPAADGLGVLRDDMVQGAKKDDRPGQIECSVRDGRDEPRSSYVEVCAPYEECGVGHLATIDGT